MYTPSSSQPMGGAPSANACKARGHEPVARPMSQSRGQCASHAAMHARRGRHVMHLCNASAGHGGVLPCTGQAHSSAQGTERVLRNCCGLGLCGTAPQHTIRWHSRCGRAQYCVSLRAPVGPSCKTVLKVEAPLCSASPPVPFGDAMMRVLPTRGSDGHIEHER